MPLKLCCLPPLTTTAHRRKQLLPSPAMARGLTDHQIEITVSDLLRRSRRVTVREAMHALRDRFGGSGRTERVCQVLKRLESQLQISADEVDVQRELEALRARVTQAEARAALSEERERRHQDLWATRYAEKVAELENQRTRPGPSSATGISHDQYLRVYQRAAELARRLARYEDPDKPSVLPE
jgi:hypothetical protein